ncbi:MAG: Flp pilus assembly complex ATPase component TadA [Deltaproteobacteria bacterium]|nr:Flp pilus assembly complex ATPase component TadA [Deltaproteobacteria bacterium]MCL5792927.1 Flp pilus assembly complex ATPase component TadA [Deltaproteobacteria bacterium]
MLEIEIFHKERLIKTEIVDKTIIIGRANDADIRLDDHLCSRRHAKIYMEESIWFAADLESSNGTFYNNEKLKAPVKLNQNDKLKIGDHEVLIKNILIPKPPFHEKESSPEYTAKPAIELDTHKIEIHKQLLEELDLKNIDLAKLETGEVRKKAVVIVKNIVTKLETGGLLPDHTDETKLIQDVIDEALGLGPLESLLEDKTINEIMVNARDEIYIEQEGRLEKTLLRFSSDRAVLNIIERIVSPLGRRVDEGSPTVDARLKDGSRVHVIIPPLAIKGPTITIRKFSKKPYTMDDLVRFGSLTSRMADFLKIAITARKNIIVSGGTGSGKTTLLNVLSSFIPEDERIITIEDSAELKLNQSHVVSLEARPSNLEGKGAVTIRDLVRNALRMRPDRIVVGECRGGEAIDMLQAMNTGHDGSLTTLHANTPRDALSRLETMVLMSGMELPIRAIKEQIRSAIDLIVQQTRFKDGSRRLSAISEVQGIEGDIIVLQDIFILETKAMADNKINYTARSTGFVPMFIEELRASNISVPQEIFL